MYRMDGGVPTRTTVQGFRDYLSNKYVESDDGTMVQIAPVWFKSARRRTYKGVEFAPEAGREGYLNTWTGWGVEPADVPFPRVMELLRDVIANGNNEHLDYILNWDAHMVQHPGRPAEVAKVIKSDKGMGKGTYARIVSQIAGHHGF